MEKSNSQSLCYESTHLPTTPLHHDTLRCHLPALSPFFDCQTPFTRDLDQIESKSIRVILNPIKVILNPIKVILNPIKGVHAAPDPNLMNRLYACEFKIAAQRAFSNDNIICKIHPSNTGSNQMPKLSCFVLHKQRTSKSSPSSEF